MPFVFSHDARRFFNRIGVKASTGSGNSTTGTLDTMFDAYWLCAQIGIQKNRFQADVDAPMITNKFVGASANYMHRIRGVAFYQYCKRQGLLSVDRSIIEEMGLFFSDEAKELNTAGYSMLNGYAHGGFQLIYERLGDHCIELADLLLDYQELLHGE